MLGGILLQSSSVLKTEGNGILQQEAPAPSENTQTNGNTLNVSLVQNINGVPFMFICAFG